MNSSVWSREPPRPSERISTLEAANELTGSFAGTENARLRRVALRGELDWIVMKTLEKDRTRRYESAGDLAHDIQRFLKDEPVTARPPSLPYHVTKFGQRHKTMIVGIMAVSVALVIGTAASLWQASEAIAARQLAEDRLVTAKEQKALAESERRRSRTLLYGSDMKLASEAVIVRGRPPSHHHRAS